MNGLAAFRLFCSSIVLSQAVYFSCVAASLSCVGRRARHTTGTQRLLEGGVTPQACSHSGMAKKWDSESTYSTTGLTSLSLCTSRGVGAAKPDRGDGGATPVRDSGGSDGTCTTALGCSVNGDAGSAIVNTPLGGDDVARRGERGGNAGIALKRDVTPPVLSIEGEPLAVGTGRTTPPSGGDDAAATPTPTAMVEAVVVAAPPAKYGKERVAAGAAALVSRSRPTSPPSNASARASGGANVDRPTGAALALPVNRLSSPDCSLPRLCCVDRKKWDGRENGSPENRHRQSATHYRQTVTPSTRQRYHPPTMPNLCDSRLVPLDSHVRLEDVEVVSVKLVH